MAAYPLSLPAPLVEGYALSPVDQTLRTEMETGAARVRRRTRARNDALELGFVFTGAEFSAFRTWFDDDAGAAGGAAWFDMTVDVGHGAATYQARFKGAFKANRDGVSWRVSAQIEVR